MPVGIGYNRYNPAFQQGFQDQNPAFQQGFGQGFQNPFQGFQGFGQQEFGQGQGQGSPAFDQGFGIPGGQGPGNPFQGFDPFQAFNFASQFEPSFLGASAEPSRVTPPSLQPQNALGTPGASTKRGGFNRAVGKIFKNQNRLNDHTGAR